MFVFSLQDPGVNCLCHADGVIARWQSTATKVKERTNKQQTKLQHISLPNICLLKYITNVHISILFFTFLTGSIWDRNCPERGYIRDENDCSIFYFCNGPIRYEFQCAAGLAFDPDKTACDYPENVPGCRPGFLNEPSRPNYT